MKTHPLLAALVVAGAVTASPQTQADQRPLESLSKANDWINSPPLAPADLRGKVVLVDFWTYTCVNWIRTLPYVRAWAAKYKDHGLVVVGVHSPEFEFEKEGAKVREAAKALRVDFPIAVDSEHAIWRAYDNEYWPAVYIVDATGKIRYRQFGEGDYARAEKAVQQLLAEAGQESVPRGLVAVATEGAEVAADWDNLRSPENYLGSQRTLNFSSRGKVIHHKAHDYALPERLSLNDWALAGNWIIAPDAVQLQKPNGRIAYRFHARDVNLVMGANLRGRVVKFRVLVDGKAPDTAHGADVDTQGFGSVSEPRLYQLIRESEPIVDRLFEIEFLDEGVQAYSFTFG